MPGFLPHRFPVRSMPAALRRSAARRPDAVFLRQLDPRDAAAPPRVLTFAAFEDGVRRAGALLAGAGFGQGDRLLLLAENSPEWQMLSLAAQALRGEPAGLFASLDASAAQAVARRVAPRALWVSAAQWAKLLPVVPALAAAGLRLVVSPDPLPAADRPEGVAWAVGPAALHGAEALSPSAWEALAAAVGPEDPFLLLFTSGTTGRMKGVRLPQRAILRAIEAGAATTAISEADVGLHFLPFGHVAGHDQLMLAVAVGHELVLASRREDIERGLGLRPTYLFSVPLVYERIAEAVQARVAAAPGPIRRLLQAALAAAARVRVGGSRRPGDRLLAALADVLVGRALRRRLGGRVRGLFAGGAAPSPALFGFFEALGVPLVELYGMTETAGMISSNLWAGPRRAGCAGLPTPDLELRFAADGELLVRGATLMTGYLDPEDDAAAFAPDGFFRTGDRARLEPGGWLVVEGRKKNLLVLSTGKKLAPEPIELAMGAAPFAGVMLLGEGRPFVAAAVFVPEPDLRRLAAGGREPAVALLELVRARLDGFSEHEKPKRLLVLAGTPQEHPSLLTPTLKLRRAALLEWIQADVDLLYAAPRAAV